VHVIGAGPVGLMLTALLQSMDGFSVRLYEKRHEYTRTRMVQLAPYLVADSVDSYRIDHIDGDNVDAVFDPAELHDGLAFRRSIPADLMALLRDWTLGFCPLNSIERATSELIDARAANGVVQRTSAIVTAEDAVAMLEPGDILIDCTGSSSLLRDHLATSSGELVKGANTLKIRLEYALVITFLYGQPYDCNEYCKYYKNAENSQYKFIPMVHRTHYDGRVSHVTGIVNISADEYQAMPSRSTASGFGATLRVSLSRWIGSSTRSRRKRRARCSATSRSCGFPSTCTELAMRPAGNGSKPGQPTTRLPPHRCSSPATRPSALRTFSRFRLDSSVRCTWRASSRGVICH
jgi:hypothetical protein